MRKLRPILSILLVLCLLLSTFPVALAEETIQDNQAPVIELDTLSIDDEDGVIERGETIKVKVKVTDSSEIVRISVMYKCNGHDNGAGASYYYTNDFDVTKYNGEFFESELYFMNDPAYYGLYEIDAIEAIDAYGNRSYMSRYTYGDGLNAGNFTVTGPDYVADDTVGPVIDYTNIVVSDVIESGEKAKISVPITDDSEIYYVQVSYGSANTNVSNAVSTAELTLNTETNRYEGEIGFNFLGENQLIGISAVDANNNESRFANSAYAFYPTDFAEHAPAITTTADASNATVYHGDPNAADTEAPVVDLSSLTLESRVIERNAESMLTLSINDNGQLVYAGLSFEHAYSGEIYHASTNTNDPDNQTGVYAFKLPSAMFGQWRLGYIEVIDTYGNATVYNDYDVTFDNELPDTDLSAGNYYVGVIDTTTGISASSADMSDTTAISVTENQLSGNTYEQMLEEGSTAHAFYDIEVTGGYGEEADLLIPAPAGLNEGDDVRVVHLLDDGTTENLDTTVVNGTVAVSVSEFSPFLLLTGFTPSSTPSDKEVTIHANGVEFFVNVTGNETGWQTGSCCGSMSTRIEAGKNLTAAGVDVYHAAAHNQYFEGWQVLLPMEQNGVVSPTPMVDEHGNELRLTTAEMLTYPIVEDTIFVPVWNPGHYTSFVWLTVRGECQFDLTYVDEGGQHTNANESHDSFPAYDPGASFTTQGIISITTPVHPDGLAFEGWYAYFRGPADAEFNTTPLNDVDANGNIIPLTTAQVLAYTNTRVGYTDFIAKFVGVEIDPNGTSTPGGNTLPTNLIINSNNGTDFTLHTNGGSETFSCQFEGYADPALGNTLADLGLISIDLDTSTPFACWVVFRPVFDNDGNIIDWEKELDEYGNDRILPNKDLILTWPINNGVMFVADWIAGGNQNGHRVEIHSSGVPYMHSVPDENGNIVSGEIGDAFGTTIASGTTLSDAGISVWQYAHNDPYFEGWLVYHQDSDGYWVEDKDSDGNFIVLDTASMLNTPITEDVRFEASWQTYSVIFEDVDGGTFDQVDPYSGETYRDDCSKAGYYVSYSYTLEEFAVITDIKNGSETFYGWDVYEEVEDPNNPGFTILIPVTGPMSTADVLSLPITYNVVFRANWTGNAPSGGSSGTPGTPAPHSAGLAISGNGGTFDIVRTNSQGKTEIWEDAEHTREDMYVSIGDTLADFGITDLTDLKFWDGQREFVGWQVYGVYTVTNQWGSYEEYGPLSDKIYTTKEILAYPAEKNFIEFVAVWAGDDADYFTDVTFDALGGTFLVTAFDYTEEGPVVLGTIPMDYLWVEDCMENGQSIKEQFDSSFYPISDPVRTGYTFEGWLAFYEDQYLHEMSDKLYTTEQVVNLPIPEENVQYLAKWKEIPMDEYRFGDPYFPYDGTYVQHYTVANGGDLEISVNYSGGKDTYSMPFLSHQGQSSMSFLEHTKDISGLEFEFDLTDKTNFEGWTTYQAERLFIIHLLEGDKLNLPANNYTAFKIDTEEYEDENGDPINLEIYMVLKNAKIYSTTMTPKEVLQLKGDTFYATVAQWHEASATLANVKAATCTAEGYTGDKVCAKCGEILEKGQTIPKAAHEISATLANVKAATCAAEGYTGDKVCAKCGEVLVKGEAIAKLAHTPSANLANVKSATHTEEGYTGDVVCADCGAVIKTGKVIDKVKETVATPVVKEESKAAVDSQIQDVVAVISGEKTEETKIVLSEGTEKAIEEAVTKGDVVGADIVIEPISEENLSAEELASFKKEAAAIENTATAELGDTATVAEFIDISVIVKNRTTGEALGNITELAKPVTIEILVPAALQAENREYYIVHFHDGQATLIKGDYKDGVLTISADKFSTYALVYADVPETPDPIVPATGDQSHLVFFTTMLLLSAAGIYLASRKLRRA